MTPFQSEQDRRFRAAAPHLHVAGHAGAYDEAPTGRGKLSAKAACTILAEVWDRFDAENLAELVKVMCGSEPDDAQAGDEPPPFQGRPEPGGTMTERDMRALDRLPPHLRKQALRVVMDARNREASRGTKGFAERFPDATRIRHA